VITGRIAATGIVELQDRESCTRQLSREQRQKAPAAKVLKTERTGDHDAAFACGRMKPTDRLVENNRSHAAAPTTRASGAKTGLDGSQPIFCLLDRE
jgi:hypothetical protein